MKPDPVYSTEWLATEWLAAWMLDNADANLRSGDTCGSRGDIDNRRGSCWRARRRWCLPSGTSGSEGVSRYEDDPGAVRTFRVVPLGGCRSYRTDGRGAWSAYRPSWRIKRIAYA